MWTDFLLPLLQCFVLPRCKNDQYAIQLSLMTQNDSVSYGSKWTRDFTHHSCALQDFPTYSIMDTSCLNSKCKKWMIKKNKTFGVLFTVAKQTLKILHIITLILHFSGNYCACSRLYQHTEQQEASSASLPNKDITLILLSEQSEIGWGVLSVCKSLCPPVSFSLWS